MHEVYKAERAESIRAPSKKAAQKVKRNIMRAATFIAIVPIALVICATTVFGEKTDSSVGTLCDENNKCPFDKVCRDSKCIDMDLPNPTLHVPRACEPRGCGTNGECEPEGKHSMPLCVCKSGFVGWPPNCYPEKCQSSDECPGERGCRNHECVNVCIAACGLNTDCEEVDKKPVCKCRSGYSGDPLIWCKETE